MLTVNNLNKLNISTDSQLYHFINKIEMPSKRIK